jgi:histidinol-phosphate aminotransferase
MYRVTARGHGLKPVEVPLDVAWDLDVGQTKRAIEMMQPSIVYIASPNNPTANRMSDGRVRDVIEASKDALAIVDEAYIDYAGPGASLRGWRSAYRHLGILRTVSKVGLAALRVGWLEADAGLVAELDKVRQPFNVSATSQAAAAAVLEDAWDEVQADVARVVAARDALAVAIGALPGFVVTPSAANFLWVKTPMPTEQVYSALLGEKILVRSFHANGGRLSTQLRITVGTNGENARLLESLEKIARQG